VTYARIVRKYNENGTELVRFRASVPLFDTYGDITAFYQALADSAEAFCGETAFPEQKQAFAAMPSGKERRLFPRRILELSCTVTESDPHCLTVTTAATYRERDTLLCAYHITHRWNTVTQMILHKKQSSKKKERSTLNT